MKLLQAKAMMLAATNAKKRTSPPPKTSCSPQKLLLHSPSEQLLSAEAIVAAIENQAVPAKAIVVATVTKTKNQAASRQSNCHHCYRHQHKLGHCPTKQSLPPPPNADSFSLFKPRHFFMVHSVSILLCSGMFYIKQLKRCSRHLLICGKARRKR